MNFKLGQDVVCVSNHPHKDINKNQVYPVIHTLMCCRQSVYTGAKVSGDHIGVRCYECNKELNTNGRYYAASTNFVPLDDHKEVNEAFSEITESLKVPQ